MRKGRRREVRRKREDGLCTEREIGRQTEEWENKGRKRRG